MYGVDMNKVSVVVMLSIMVLMIKPDQVQAGESSEYLLYSSLSSQFFALTKEHNDRWQKAVDNLEEQRILQLSELNSAAAFDRHAKALADYEQATRTYHTFLKELRQRTTAHLRSDELTDEQLEPVVESLMKNHLALKSAQMKVLAAHLRRVKTMNNYLTFLDANQANWVLQNGQVEFENLELKEQNIQFESQLSYQQNSIESLLKRLPPDSV